MTQTLRNDGRPSSGRTWAAPQLYVVLEASRPRGAAARHALADVDEVVVGRGSERQSARVVAGGARCLLLSIPDRWLSTQHARLVRRSGQCTIHDLGSTNGTLVNGVAVTSKVLADGDLLELGHTFFVYRAAVPVSDDDLDDVEAGADTGGTRGLISLVPTLIARFADLERVAASTVSVVIGGETGTGKELAARAVHAASRRRGPFVAVNCGAIPRTLVESELFGHKKGAFSGATDDRVGLVASADGGTLFLDEIADLPKESQAALLRVLQEREVTPVGATRPIPIDLRLVSATHADLDELTAQGRFRVDLAARLSGFTLRLPPLRDRREDLGLLIAAVLDDLGAGDVQFSDTAARALMTYAWPRNIRELRTCLEAAIALSGGRTIELDHLGVLGGAGERPRSEPLGEADDLSTTDDYPSEDSSVPADPDDPRRAQLDALLREHRGNVSAIARALGKARTQVQRWLRRHGLDAERYR